jgi:hypothetical protein
MEPARCWELKMGSLLRSWSSARPMGNSLATLSYEAVEYETILREAGGGDMDG